MFWAVFTR